MPTDRSIIELFIFLLITLLAEVLGTIGGFGSSLFFVSASQFFFDMQTVLVLTGLLHIFSNSSKMYLFRRSVDWKLVLWMGIPSTVLATAGALMTTIVDLSYTKAILGFFLVAIATLFLLKPNLRLSPTWVSSGIGGAIAGFLAGFVGTGGAIRGVILTSFALSSDALIATSAAVDFGVDFTRSIVYIDHDYLHKNMYVYIPILMVASYLGSYIGKVAIGRISQERFKTILLSVILITGASMILGFWF
jgi:uncharacterized membrane protein YfcA